MPSASESDEGVKRRKPSDEDPLPRKELPKKLQHIVDEEDTIWDSIYDGNAPETTDTSLRYAAYANRFRTILLSAQRYVAYTSDVGESFRPIAHPWLIKTAYGISWTYLIGDVGYEGYKAYLRNEQKRHPHTADQKALSSVDATMGTSLSVVKIPAIEDYRAVMAQRAVFQSVASMGLPAFTIHSIVRYSGRAMKDVKNARLRTWGPIGLGLAAVPFLPYMFDEPVEKATEWVFHKGFEAVGGPDAVGHGSGSKSVTQALKEKTGVSKEKEL